MFYLFNCLWSFFSRSKNFWGIVRSSKKTTFDEVIFDLTTKALVAPKPSLVIQALGTLERQR